jgi:hypothetical protein
MPNPYQANSERYRAIFAFTEYCVDVGRAKIKNISDMRELADLRIQTHRIWFHFFVQLPGPATFRDRLPRKDLEICRQRIFQSSVGV